MKNLVLGFFFAISLSVVAQAQTETFRPIPVETANRAFADPFRSASPQAIKKDTVYPYSSSLACGDTITYYNLNAGGGIASGTNKSLRKEFGIKVKHKGPFTAVEAFVFLFVAQSATNPDISVASYQMRANNAVDTNTRTASDPQPLSTLKGRAYNQFVFSTLGVLSDSALFAITVPPGALGDTIAIATSRVGCTAPSPKITTFTRLVNGTFTPINKSIQNFNVDLILIGIVEYDDALATLKTLSEGTKLYPVPARNEVMVALPANLTGKADWQLTTTTGQVAQKGNHQGANLFSVPQQDLHGVYFLRMQTNAGPIVKRVVFE